MPRITRKSSKDQESLGDPENEFKKTAAKSKKKAAKSSKEKADRWVFLMNDEIVNVDKDITDDDGKDSQPVICQLRHPRMGEGALYLMPAKHDRLYEIQCFKEKYRSWFIGESVQSRGDLFITTPVDPIFLVLPYLINAGQKFMSLDQIVCDDDFPDCQKLVNCVANDQLGLVADCKDIDDDLRVCRYNSEKTLSWLKAKADSLTDTLQKNKTNVSAKGSQSAIFVRSNNAETPKDAYMAFAVGVLSDYVSSQLETDLKSHLGISEKENLTSPEPAEKEPPNKKAKLDSDSGPTEDYTKKMDMKLLKAKPGKQTKAQKQLDKVDKSGMKSMMSFFSPKTKS